MTPTTRKRRKEIEERLISMTFDELLRIENVLYLVRQGKAWGVDETSRIAALLVPEPREGKT